MDLDGFPGFNESELMGLGCFGFGFGRGVPAPMNCCSELEEGPCSGSVRNALAHMICLLQNPLEARILLYFCDKGENLGRVCCTRDVRNHGSPMFMLGQGFHRLVGGGMECCRRNFNLS